MSLLELCNDTVSVIKKDGKRFDEVKAIVQGNIIFIEDPKFIIELGDLVDRKLSNGGDETYEVLDPIFSEKFHGMPASYNLKVKKLGIP